MAEKYKIKSDYTLLRKKSQTVDDGNIYENDIMTISPMADLFDDGQVLYADSNFRFSVNNSLNLKKKHTRNSWEKTPSGKIEWTYSDVEDSPISEESEVRIKPDYSRLNDFAYFGSAVKMVEAAVNDVVMNFPAELYFTDKKIELNGTTYYIISNDFQINADIPYIGEDNVPNPMRYLCSKIADYNYVTKSGAVTSGLTISITQNSGWTCENNEKGGIFASATVKTNGGKLVDIYTYQKSDIKTLLYTDTALNGCSIRPSDAVVDRFFYTIDLFEFVLLDRTSNPIYKAVFETPYQTETGFFYKMKSYIWPSINGWNPDLASQAYTKYINSLISLADFYDEYYSDNLWRMGTHEAIKNLDWTFMRDKGDTIEDLSNIDTSRIEPAIRLYGRQFDGIKRYIDNIKHSNQVTYNQKNNLPDYCLTDVAGLSGWDALVIKPKAQSNVVGDIIYSAMTKGFSEVDMNTYFMRNLKINSRALMSMKGTRKGVEAMLGLLGIREDEYKIHEKIGIAKGGDKCEFSGATPSSASSVYPTYESIRLINERKDNFIFGEEDIQTDELQGLAVKQVKDYVVPWFDSSVEHDGDWYFQCKGGWGKRKDKQIYLPELTNVTAITATADFPIYDETEPYMKFATDISEMLHYLPGEVKAGDVCYVNDVTDIDTYKEYDSIKSEITASGISHYFILKDVNRSTYFGEDGWKYITVTEIRTASSTNGKKVVYLESLVDKTEGNNPHIGKGEYDDGREYIDYLDNIFKNAIETSGMSLFTKTDIDNIKKYYKFNISGATDDIKCWYFLNATGNNYTSSIDKLKDETISNEDKNTQFINPESGDKRLIAAANSVVNLKNMEIVFDYPKVFSGITALKQEWKQYIDNIAMEYVKQMLPSTTILEYYMSGETTYSVAIPIDDTNPYSTANKVYGITYTDMDAADGNDSSNTNKIIKKS